MRHYRESIIASGVLSPEERRRAAWEREYTSLRGIHSTYAEGEAVCFPFFRDILRKEGFDFKGTVLDVGCGNGRNAVWFLQRCMKVVGTDFSRSALGEFRARSLQLGGEQELHLILCDMEQPPPFRENLFEIIMNITTLENLVGPGSLGRYARRTVELLRRGGYLLLYSFLREDGYYGPMLDPGQSIVSFEGDDFPVAIHTPEEIVTCFRSLSRIASRTFEFSGPMRGKEYTRRLSAIVMKKD
jgi:SAM-dependent methyltransferase